ncbi:Oidioi.mRNA.OKI2018_I69.PAR.g8716.t1.cds [Oikopleura dioica]|uniref:Oidioi.mRNA.OKI2018_I69.PAR.g8716.t1.cds n=1 Tax=Oikopleura dioica TaxID=34765 RepID=A0ABN7RKU6_OIKDI|nr:Oidioi.mRNA.OKI2018_I69.PAR.g8716.t1.cds [Oikopleura dioica]
MEELLKKNEDYAIPGEKRRLGTFRQEGKLNTSRVVSSFVYIGFSSAFAVMFGSNHEKIKLQLASDKIEKIDCGIGEEISCADLFIIAPDNAIVGDIVFFTAEAMEAIEEKICDPVEDFKTCFFRDPRIPIRNESIDEFSNQTDIAYGMAHVILDEGSLVHGSVWLIPRDSEDILIFPGINGNLVELDRTMEEYSFYAVMDGFIFITQPKDYHMEILIDDIPANRMMLPRRSEIRKAQMQATYVDVAMIDAQNSLIKIDVKEGQKIKIKKIIPVSLSKYYWSRESLKMNFYTDEWKTSGSLIQKMCDFCSAQRRIEQAQNGSTCEQREWFRQQLEPLWFPIQNGKRCSFEIPGLGKKDSFSVVSNHGNNKNTPNIMISPGLVLARDTYFQQCHLSMELKISSAAADRFNLQLSLLQEANPAKRDLIRTSIERIENNLMITGDFIPFQGRNYIQISISAIGSMTFVAKEMTISKCKMMKSQPRVP